MTMVTKATPMALLVCVVTMATLAVASSENDAKAMEDRPVLGRFRRQCPTGLWCGKKRALAEEPPIKSNQQVDNLPSIRERLAKRQNCPTGLWCGKKREIEGSKSYEAIPNTSFQKLSKRQGCPTGLWCGKRSVLQSLKSSAEKPRDVRQPMPPQGASNVVEPQGYHTVENDASEDTEYDFE